MLVIDGEANGITHIGSSILNAACYAWSGRFTSV
jgi:hypothetical protein